MYELMSSPVTINRVKNRVSSSSSLAEPLRLGLVIFQSGWFKFWSTSTTTTLLLDFLNDIPIPLYAEMTTFDVITIINKHIGLMDIGISKDLSYWCIPSSKH